MFSLKHMTVVSRCHMVSTVLAAILVCSGSIRSFGQETPAARPPREAASEATRGPAAQPANTPQPPHQIQIFALKNAEAKEVLQTIRQVYDEQRSPFVYRIAVDQRTNSVIISAQPAMMSEIQELIRALDSSAAQEKNQQVKIFHLQNIQASPPLLQTLSMVTDQQTRLSADEQRNAVVAAGPSASLQMVEALLVRLDEMAPESPKSTGEPPQEMQLRLVWLATDLPAASASEPPQDLQNVLGELEKIGVGGLKLVTQIVVKTMDEQQFSASGSAHLEEPCRLSVSGHVMQDRAFFGGSPETAAPRSLKLEISAVNEGNPGSRLCQLETTINAPLGQSVVLGVTPVGSKPTVFVVQMMLPAGEATK